VNDRELDSWNRKDPTFAAPFFGSDHPLARALAPLRSRLVRPSELLMELLISDEIEAELGAPLLGLWHRAEELSSRGLSFHEVVMELARSMDEKRRERDVPPPRNLGQLVVLTVHGSKGLEFPHVILLDFGPRPARAASSPLLYWDRERGAYLARRTDDGGRDKKDPIEESFKSAERAKDLAESKRVFYVALTRARERLVLVFPPEGEKPFEIDDKVYERDFWRGWIEAGGGELPRGVVPDLGAGGGAGEAVVATAGAVDGDDTGAGGGGVVGPGVEAGLGAVAPSRRRRVSIPSTPKRPRHSVTEWTTLARCPRAYEWTYVRPVAVAPGIPEIGLYTGEKVERASQLEITQTELGTRVHGCLELGDYDGLKRIEEEVGSERFQAEPVISWALSSPWMSPGAESWPELAFELPVAGEVLVGSLDRLVRPEPARYAIIDFKVTEKLKTVEALLEAYEPQLQLYAYALGAIEPEARGATEALLVNISSRTVQTVPVPIDPERGSELARASASHAGRIVAGAEGAATPGPLCRVCEFRSRCSVGASWLAVRARGE
jgi:hypothetical protein